MSIKPLIHPSLFSCLHEEPAHSNSLDREVHHSVFRAALGLKLNGVRKNKIYVQDFAVLWDEDHDKRVILVAEALLVENMFSHVLFIGEREGSLSLVLNTDTIGENFDEDRYIKRVEDVCCKSNGGDYWPCELYGMSRVSSILTETYTESNIGGLLNDGEESTLAYLRSIDAVWRLGVKSYKSEILVSPGDARAY